MSKSIYFFTVLFSLALLSLAKPASLKKFDLDNAESTIKWTGKKVTGSHWGFIKFSDGTLSVSNGALKGGTFNIDMTSMDCQDTKGEYGDKLIGHLKSDDFFASEKFPKSTLVIKSISNKGKGKYVIAADLTIKGITKRVSFPANVSISKSNLTATATFNINRTKYDIKYGSGSFFENLGDKAIDDNFKVEIKIIAKTA